MAKGIRALLAAGALVVAVPASASVIVLDFKNIGNLNPGGDFYTGGEGTSSGIEFSPERLATVDEDAGGTGATSNEPASDTPELSREANDAILDVPEGFDTGLSDFDAASTAASVNVYDGLDATADLDALSLVAEVTAANDVGGTNQTTPDNTTSGSADPLRSSVAEPAILAVLGAGLALAVVMLWRGRRLGHSAKGRRRGSGRVIVRGVR